MEQFLTIATVLSITAVLSFVNERFLKLQKTVGLMLLAVALTVALALLKALGFGDLFTGEQAFVAKLALDHVLLEGLLCFMLFAGSVNVKARFLEEQRWVILALAIGGTLISAALTGVALWFVFGLFGLAFGLIYAFVFGALISPTDPIAALAILGKVGLPPRLEAIINGESLFNDGVGVVIFTIGLALALGTQQASMGDAVVLFLREVLGGIALGAAAAALMHFLITKSRDYGTQVLASLAVVALGYGIAEQIEVSGPIAMVVTGLIFGNVSMPRAREAEREPFKNFWEAIDEVLNAVLFVLIGLHLALIPPYPGGLPSASIAIGVCLVMRWISVYLPLLALGASGLLKAQTLGLTNLLTWGGLRGGLALAMAFSLPDSPEKSLILHMTYGVVAFSILVQGLTVGKIFKAERLKKLLA